MDKVDWKRKLSSRKFWLAIIGFVTAVAAAFGMSEASVAQITTIIMAGATLIAYILGESWVDANSIVEIENAVPDMAHGSQLEQPWMCHCGYGGNRAVDNGVCPACGGVCSLPID